MQCNYMFDVFKKFGYKIYQIKPEFPYSSVSTGMAFKVIAIMKGWGLQYDTKLQEKMGSFEKCYS